ncbi:MAG TPA: 2-isopropylmalate synthase [Planctomycetota bacterium]|nr:2-isopropylmalate synthase [Planctomycetota bacterium]
MADRVIIFDTTLRDGEQSPGASMNTAEKIEIARALAAMRVDVIEAGFPIASPGDFEAVSRVAAEVKGATIAGLARALEKDILRAHEAVKGAERPRIHVFLATSKIHMEHKLKKAKEEIVRLAVEGVKLARNLVGDVEFSPEDASRTEPDFLCEVVEATIAAGATTVNIPDTVGYAEPEQFGALIATLRNRVPNIDKAVISVHCHNDLGLAVANSLAAVKAGARQVECTINGLGERAGNAALEEIVMNLKTRRDYFGADSGVLTQRLVPTSKLVASLTGLFVQRNKAIVGLNAFAHEAGIHQHGMLVNSACYEIMRPEDVGLQKSDLVIGKHSGHHAIGDRARELGYELADEQLTQVVAEVKALADKKKQIFDDDLRTIIEGVAAEAKGLFRLVKFQTTSGSTTIPTATVVLQRDDEEPVQDAATGDGPVDAVYKTIDRITGITGKLLDYQIRAVTSGKDALGEASLLFESEGLRVSGRAASTDILEASAQAYIVAVNKVAALLNHKKKANGTPAADEHP